MAIKIHAIITESIDERFSKSTPVEIELDEESLTKLAIAIFHAKVYGLFNRSTTLIEKLKDLDFQSLF